MIRSSWLVFLAVAAGCGEQAVTDDSGDDDTDDTDDGVAPGEYALINHEDPCPSASLIVPAAGEEAHWALARLTPPGYPFVVDDMLGFFLENEDAGNGASCIGASTHAIEAWVAGGTAPVATPTAQYTTTATTDETAEGVWVISAEPDANVLRLEEGEHLFVSVQMSGTFPDVSCMMACGSSESPDRNYWSNAGTTPYSWATLASYGLDVDFSILARGRVLPPDPDNDDDDDGGNDPY